MKHLIYNGKDLGAVKAYRQNRDRKQWTFLMDDEYIISIDWFLIKSFSSCDNLEIITYTA